MSVVSVYACVCVHGVYFSLWWCCQPPAAFSELRSGNSNVHLLKCFWRVSLADTQFSVCIYANDLCMILHFLPFNVIFNSVPFYRCCIWSLMFCARHKRRVTASLPSYLSEKYTFVILLAFLSSSGTYQYLINADSTWPAAPAMSLNGQKKKRSIERLCWLKVGAGPCKNELIHFHITYAASLFFHLTVFLLRLLLKFFFPFISLSYCLLFLC